MEKDILVILMIAFGLFAIVMFVLFFVYLKKYYNSKHINDNYQIDMDERIEQEEHEEIVQKGFESDMEFVPVKKKKYD